MGLELESMRKSMSGAQDVCGCMQYVQVCKTIGTTERGSMELLKEIVS